MKKVLYSALIFFAALTVYASKATAQYYITSTSWQPTVDSADYCQFPRVYVTTNAYAAGLTVTAYYGDGDTTTSPVVSGGTFGYADCYSSYTFPGTYSIKYVLYNGAVPS